jgi:predicted CoA-binding protein
VSTARPTVAVIGASNDRSKFGNKAVRAFLNRGWDVYPINPSVSEVEGIRAYPSVGAVPRDRLDRVSFYVPPRVGLEIVEQLVNCDIGEVWLNPGSGSRELVERASALGLSVIEDCSILAIGERPGDY